MCEIGASAPLQCEPMNIPLLIAHRGYACRYPENTLEAIQAALEVGACYVEWDIQLARDGVPVLLHDATLLRTAGRPEAVFELSSARLATIAVGQREIFGERFAGVRTPTLAAAVELMTRWPRAQAFAEVKPESVERFGVARVVESVAADLERSGDQIVPISSVVEFLVLARRADLPRVGLVLKEWSEEAHRTLERLQPDFVFCNLKRLPDEAELWLGSWRWVVYEVVDPDLALRLAARGVDLIETMAIGEMLADPRLVPRGCRD